MSQIYWKSGPIPKLYTEATLLSAMETAGRLVDNDDLRDALKENGIDVLLHELQLLKPYLNAITSRKIKRTYCPLKLE